MKRSIFIGILLLFVAQVFAQKVDWYLDRNAVYPHKLWITAEGRGATQKEAEQNALDSISLYFQTSTNVVIVAIEKYREASDAYSKLMKTTEEKSL